MKKAVVGLTACILMVSSESSFAAELRAIDLSMTAGSMELTGTHPGKLGAVAEPDTAFFAEDGTVRHGVRCGTPSLGTGAMVEVEAEIAQFLSPETARPEAGAINTIEIVLYNVHIGAEGPVSEEQLIDQLAVLNAAFKAGGVQFKYRNDEYFLVDATNVPGAFYIRKGSAEEAALKSQFREDPKRYLNLYTTDPQGGVLGWATFPKDLKAKPLLDGVVVQFESLPGGASEPYNLGDTATHEVGHWLGLYHTFQGGCLGKGDEVADTPAEASPAFGCPVGRNTCSSKGSDPVFNFMDYTDDACLNTFTKQQRARIKAHVATYRSKI